MLVDARGPSDDDVWRVSAILAPLRKCYYLIIYLLAGVVWRQ